MCLGIPGEVIEVVDPVHRLALVEVAGVRRKVNFALLEDEEVGPGTWVLIHVGFAMARIDEREAEMALESLRVMGQAYLDEIEAVRESPIG